MKRRYVTRTEAIDAEIIQPIQAGASSVEEYDIDRIADEVLGDYSDGYALKVGQDAFWDAVRAAEL